MRPIGARDTQPMPGAPLPGFFWQWTPINFPGGSLFFHVNNDAQGNAWVGVPAMNMPLHQFGEPDGVARNEGMAACCSTNSDL